MKEATIQQREFTFVQKQRLQQIQGILFRQRLARSTFNPDDWRVNLTNRALFTRFLDCVAAGIGAEALGLIEASKTQPEIIPPLEIPIAPEVEQKMKEQFSPGEYNKLLGMKTLFGQGD